MTEIISGMPKTACRPFAGARHTGKLPVALAIFAGFFAFTAPSHAFANAQTIAGDRGVTVRGLTLSRIEGSGPQYVASEIVREAGRRSGINIDILTLPAARARQHTIDQLSDGEVGRIRAFFDQNPHLHRVTPAIMTSSAVAMVAPQEDTPGVAAPTSSSLDGYRIGVVRGVIQSAEAVQGLPHVHVVGTPRQLYRMLASGRIDVAVDFRMNADRFSRELQVPFITIGALSEEWMYVGLQERHASLVPWISAALVEMKEDGTMERISNEAARRYVLGLVD